MPLYPIGLGDPEPARDLELTELLVDDVVFVDDMVRFQAKLHGTRLRRPGGRRSDSRSATPSRPTPRPRASWRAIRVQAPPDGQPKRIEIGHRPKQTGEITYILEVEPRPRELQTENNRIEHTVNVRKEKLKVLFVDSEPRYEYRYLKNYLEREETIDLSVVLLSSDPEYSEQDRSALPTFPAAKDELFDFDVVLLGDADPSFLSLSQMQNLAEFVTEKGGGVLFIAGENFDPLVYRGTPLELLLPIELAEARNPTAHRPRRSRSFRPELTLEGRSSPIFRFGDDEATERPDLAEPARALLVARSPAQEAGGAGAGRTSDADAVRTASCRSSSTSSSARASRCSTPSTTPGGWRFRVGDRYFGRFWIQTIRFLARSKLLGQQQAEVQTDRRRYQRNQPIQIRVRFPNPGIAPGGGRGERAGRAQGARLAEAGAEARARQPQPVRGGMPQAAEGDYKVRLLPPPVLDGPDPDHHVPRRAPRRRDGADPMNESELIRAATVTGGKFYTPETTATLLRTFPGRKKCRSTPIRRSRSGTPGRSSACS